LFVDELQLEKASRICNSDKAKVNDQDPPPELTKKRWTNSIHMILQKWFLNKKRGIKCIGQLN